MAKNESVDQIATPAKIAANRAYEQLSRFITTALGPMTAGAADKLITKAELDRISKGN
jgi:hypothetical protein